MSVFEARQDTVFGDPDKFVIVSPSVDYFDAVRDNAIGRLFITGLSPTAQWRPVKGRTSIYDQPQSVLATSH